MKNKILIAFSFLMLSSALAFSQTNTKVVTTTDRSSILGKSFLLIKAKTLLGNSIVFPTIAKNKFCIVCIAFNDDGRPKSDTWMNEIPEKYTDSLIVFYEIPMIKNAPKLFRDVIEKGMKKGTKIGLHNNIANYYGNIDVYKKQLLMDDEASCYTFLLDKDGIIRFSVEGGVNPENLKQLDDTLKGLMK
jgi:ATP10 protein